MAQKNKASLLGKFTRPRAVGTLPRPRLFRALDLALQQPVAWVSGPPGSGKTTLASSYVAERKLRALWYRFHDDDADPATFFHYFGLALDAIAPARGRRLLPALTAEYRASLATFSRRYFERAWQRLKAPCVIVFDNCEHGDRDAPLCEVMRELVESLPEGIHAIMLCRADPPPSFAALRARGTIALVDGSALRLSEEECAELAALRGVTVAGPALRRLHERTHGWTAGVVLALEQRSRAPAGDGPPSEATTPQVLFDYFAGEIFDKMPAELQGLLLRAALLPAMAAGRLAKLTGMARADEVLGELARTGYFTVKLAAHGAVPALYQFHPLFREFLLRRAQDSVAGEQLAELQRKAAALLEADGELAEAVALLTNARAWDEVLRVALTCAPSLLEQGRGAVLEGWLRAVPSALCEQEPWALYWLARSRLAAAPRDARDCFERAFRLFEVRDDRTGLFSAWAGIVDSFVHEWSQFGPLDRWIAVMDELLARDAGFPSPEVEARVVAGMFTALMYRQPQRADLPRWAERVHKLVVASGDARRRIMLASGLVHYYSFWQGDPASARLVLETIGRPSAAEIGELATIAACAMSAGYAWYVGAYDECLRSVREGLEASRRSGARFMNSHLESHGVMGSLAAGDLEGAQRFLEDAAASMPEGLVYRAHYHYLASLTAFFRGDTAHALASAREAVALADEAGVPFVHAFYGVLLALVLFAHGHRRAALAGLAQSRRAARRMRNGNIEVSCWYTGAYFLLERGKRRFALPLLGKALAAGRRSGVSYRSYWTPEFMTRVFGAALEDGIEVHYVQELIRRRRLPPSGEAMRLEQWPFAVRVYALGRFRVLLQGKPLEFTGKAQKKPLELLMALVAFGAREVSEQRLSEALWPDAEGDAAHQACAVALHRLRRLLGCEQAVTLARNHLSLDPRYVWVDVRAFERGALELYRGAFLAEQAEAPWAVPLRERLHARYLRSAAERARGFLAEGEYASAIAALEGALHVDPLAEELYQVLMLCYRALDRRAEAIKVYRRCEKTLAAGLGVAPGGGTVALYQSLQR